MSNPLIDRILDELNQATEARQEIVDRMRAVEGEIPQKLQDELDAIFATERRLQDQLKTVVGARQGRV